MYTQASSDCRRAVELVFEWFVTTFHKKYLQSAGRLGGSWDSHWCWWLVSPSHWEFIPIICKGLSVSIIGVFLLKHRQIIIRSWKSWTTGYPDIHILALYSVANESVAAGIYDLRWMPQQIIVSDWLYLVSGFYFGLAECHHEAYRIKATSNSGMYYCWFHFLLFSSDGLL